MERLAFAVALAPIEAAVIAFGIGLAVRRRRPESLTAPNLFTWFVTLWASMTILGIFVSRVSLSVLDVLLPLLVLVSGVRTLLRESPGSSMAGRSIYGRWAVALGLSQVVGAAVIALLLASGPR